MNKVEVSNEGIVYCDGKPCCKWVLPDNTCESCPIDTFSELLDIIRSTKPIKFMNKVEVSKEGIVFCDGIPCSNWMFPDNTCENCPIVMFSEILDLIRSTKKNKVMNYDEILHDTKECDIKVRFEDGTWVALDLYNCGWEYQEDDDDEASYFSGGYTVDLDSNTVVDFDGVCYLPDRVVKVLKWFYKIDL